MGATKTAQYSNEIKLTADINRALAHPARLTIIQSLKKQPGLRPVDLMNIVSLSHTATSEHLERLKHIGIIEYRYSFHHYHVFLVPDRLEDAMIFLKEVYEE